MARFSTGGSRADRFTVAPRESLSVKMSALFGSQANTLSTTLTDLTVTCNGGQLPCAASFFYLASPSCIP